MIGSARNLDNVMFHNDRLKRHRASARELLIIAASGAVVFVCAGLFDLFELIDDWLKEHNNWQVDELFVTSAFLMVAISVFAIRRWRELVKVLDDREEMLTELRAAKDAAEAANRAKGEFLANMSHEIRTPMNAVIGMTELTLETELLPEQREHLSLVKGSANALLGILNDILDFSKIEAGKLELDRTDFALRDLVGDTLKALSVRAHEKNLELTYRVDPQVADDLIGDPLRLRQVLVNLVGNAIKFTDRGEVVVGVEKASGSAGPLESATQTDAWGADEIELRFSVRDTGVGIPPGKHFAIFESFAQADGSSTRRFGGTGLGLTISARILALMNGRIWLDSSVGQGSTFHFTARFSVQRDPQPKHSATDVDLQESRILIVDDNSTNRLILAEHVSSWRMSPTSVDGGIAALEALKEAAAAGDPFDLVLLDGNMPGMDGFEVIERIRTEPALEHITVMMLSSADGAGDAARCRALGAAGYLRKPVTSSELFDAIRLALGRTEIRRQAVPPCSSLADSKLRPLNILLAEDNPVNQRVAARILEKRGHTVSSVADGKEVLQALACEKFDLVLMDVQMPEMDGLEATAAVRQSEERTGGHVPIIAMTAHVMKGDRERCLKAGMDDYVAKPIDAQQLFSVIQRTLEICASPVQSTQPEPVVHSTHEGQCVGSNDNIAADAITHRADPFDLQSLRTRLEDDEELLEELIELFLCSSPALVSELELGVADRDCHRIERAAHAIKGAFRNLCAAPCAEAAWELESMARSKELVNVDQALSTLQDELQRFRLALQSVTKGSLA